MIYAKGQMSFLHEFYMNLEEWEILYFEQEPIMYKH